MTNPTMIEAMHAGLDAVGQAEVDIAPPLFDRFLAAHPEQRAAFINLDAARGRMTSETIEAMLGLAADEPWVATTVINFVDLHRNYGAFPASLYDDFIDAAVDLLAEAAGTGWTRACDQAWRTQAARLKAMVADAIAATS